MIRGSWLAAKKTLRETKIIVIKRLFYPGSIWAMLLYGFIKTEKSVIAYHLLLGSQLPTFRSYELFSALSARTKSDFITKASNLNANAKQVKPIPLYLPAKEMGRTVTGK